MQRSCTHCQAAFSVTSDDLRFLENLAPTIGGKTIDIPPPTHCPDCRQQRRAAQVNELHLYKRKCDKTGKEILSNFHPSAPFTIYDQHVWYSDAWDALEYGRDFDFNRPFFEQYRELCESVPHFNLFTGYQYDENCDYTNYAGKNRNCYLIFDSDECRDCYDSYSINGCTSCMDCYRTRRCELCYESIDCTNCYGSSFLQDCDNCSDSVFLKNCIGCRKCLMCSNLRDKECFVENRKVSREEFDRLRGMLTARSRVRSAAARFEKLKLEFPQKYMHGVQNENAIGDYLVECKNAEHCFDSERLWDCRYVYQGFMPLRNCMDTHECGEGERLYECSVCGYNANALTLSANCLDQISDILYSTYCIHSSHVFGCCGLNRKSFCIFNKQYGREEYGQRAIRIIEHMQRTGEWGEFFPVTLSPFCYNETSAHDYYPRTKEEVLTQGWSWREDDKREFRHFSTKLPDDIADTGDDVIGTLLACSETGKNYKIIARELALLRQMRIPVPDVCFIARHERRRAMRSPRKLCNRACAKCGREIQTTYAPERPETVYCETCYLQDVY